MSPLLATLLSVAAFTSPVPIQIVAPTYPEAVKARMETTIRVVATVNPDGTVAEAQVVRPVNPLLDRVSREAACEWRIEPSLTSEAFVVELHFQFSVRIDPGLKADCFVGPPEVMFLAPDRVRLTGVIKPPSLTINY